MCYGGTHRFSTVASDTDTTIHDAMRCACGQITYGEGKAHVKAVADLQAELAAALAQNDALRAALEEIRDVQTGRYTTSRHPDEIIANIVSKALAGQTAGVGGE